MWYVAQVNSGQEAAVRDMCKQMIDPAILQDAFLPEYETMRKIQGEWKRVRRMLFPGYLFMVTDSILALLSELKKVPATTRLLGQNGQKNEITPLSEEEKDWIVAFTDDAYCVRMSEAILKERPLRLPKGRYSGRKRSLRRSTDIKGEH